MVLTHSSTARAGDVPNKSSPEAVPTEARIVRVLERYGRAATYVVRNAMSDFGRGPNLTTAQVLRILKRMERNGQVRRVPSNYAVMLVWALPA